MSKKCKMHLCCVVFIYLFVFAINFISFGGAAVLSVGGGTHTSVVNVSSYEPSYTNLTIDYPTYQVAGKIIWAKDWKTKRWTLNFNGTNNKFIQATNGWYSVTESADGIAVSDMYFVDNNGFLVTGFITTLDGSTYYMQEKENENFGKMVFGWQQTQDDKWYYFDNKGKMVKDGYSPDGMYLSADGSWIKGGATFGPGGELIGNQVRLVSNNQARQRIWEDNHKIENPKKNVSHKVEFSKGPGEGMAVDSDETTIISSKVDNSTSNTTTLLKRQTGGSNSSVGDDGEVGVFTYTGEAPTQEVKGPGAFIVEEDEEYIYYYE